MRRLVLSAFVCGALVAAAPAPTPPRPTPTPAVPAADTKTQVDAIFAEYDRSDSPGCSLGVYRDGRIAYARGYGMANLELGVANSPQTVFDIGSTSKQFTAFSIQLLAREGKLSLDDDIRKWLPEMPSYGKPITIRHLLHHISGLRDYLVAMELSGMQEEDWTTEQDALDIIARQKGINFPPGQEYLYSNTGYFLLGVIVKRASGQPLREFAAEHIFVPLGMRHTQFNELHTRIIPNRATGYRKQKPPAAAFGIEMSNWEQIGDGSVLTTVEDLQRWDENFYEPRNGVGDAALIQTMQVVGVLNSGKKIAYASALSIGNYRGLRTVSHGGSWAGYRAQLLRYPDQHFSVACLCNLAQANPSRLATKVSEVYLGSLMTKKDEPKPAQAAGNVKVAAPPKNLQALVGLYRDPESSELVRLAIWDDKLTANVGDRNYPLTPLGANRYRLEGYEGGKTEVEIPPATAGGGARPKLTVTTTEEEEEPETQTFEPVEPWTPTAAELAPLAGLYSSEEVGTTWKLVAEGDKLIIKHRGVSEEPLKPTVRDTFTHEGIQLTFQRGPKGEVTGFLVDAGRVKSLAFKKQTPAS
ncbi:MAG TPA: serine hydrolase domain-containing protein [Thermoanaerobaculia bacterium]|jgi:CubicO group peptidase (beta-lactamase class C family)